MFFFYNTIRKNSSFFALFYSKYVQEGSASLQILFQDNEKDIVIKIGGLRTTAMEDWDVVENFNAMMYFFFFSDVF